MSTGTSKPGRDVLLCERCGYVLSGLPTDAACPECGKAIAESLPSARTLAYDPKGGMGWVRVAVRMVRSPFGAYETVKIDVERARGFATRSFAIVSVIAGVGVMLPLIGFYGLPRTDATSALGWMLKQAASIVPVVMLGTFVLLWLVLLIERAGSRVIGLTHRWRITGEVAYCVCAYASVGWLLGALGLAVSGAWYALRIADENFAASSEGFYVMYGGLAAAFLLGLFGYELLVYIGLRRCKFANVEGAR